MTEATENTNRQTKRKSLLGFVMSVSGDKTIRVDVNNLAKHPIYGKFVGQRTRLAVHDEKCEAGVGDQVEIVSCRRLSKSKNHRLLRVVRQAKMGR